MKGYRIALQYSGGGYISTLFKHNVDGVILKRVLTPNFETIWYQQIGGYWNWEWFPLTKQMKEEREKRMNIRA